MRTRIWLDDKRLPPDDTWTWVKTPQDCINYLMGCEHSSCCYVLVDELSLDFNMSDVRKHGNGLLVLEWIEAQIPNGYSVPPIITIHSTSRDGKPALEKALAKIRQLEKARNESISRR